MELRELRAFVAVVEEGGLSAAARRLHVSQPALSQTVGGLERQLGVKLLVRGSTGVRATEAGTALLEEARAVLARHDQALEIRGELRTYRIHLGSGNILMAPDDTYLCIVPSSDSPTDGQAYLPFEGDQMLAVILSKALLLARDTAITDPTITSQLALR